MLLLILEGSHKKTSMIVTFIENMTNLKVTGNLFVATFFAQEFRASKSHKPIICKQQQVMPLEDTHIPQWQSAHLDVQGPGISPQSCKPKVLGKASTLSPN